jgi:hypothetical protein
MQPKKKQGVGQNKNFGKLLKTYLKWIFYLYSLKFPKFERSKEKNTQFISIYWGLSLSYFKGSWTVSKKFYLPLIYRSYTKTYCS